MAEQPKLEPGDLSEEECRAIVVAVREILWPRGVDQETHQWTADEIADIAQVLCDFGLYPG